MLSCVTCKFLSSLLVSVCLEVIFMCSVFEAERPGCRFSVQQRIATFFYKVRVIDLLLLAKSIFIP